MNALPKSWVASLADPGGVEPGPPIPSYTVQLCFNNTDTSCIRGVVQTVSAQHQLTDLGSFRQNPGSGSGHMVSQNIALKWLCQLYGFSPALWWCYPTSNKTGIWFVHPIKWGVVSDFVMQVYWLMFRREHFREGHFMKWTLNVTSRVFFWIWYTGMIEIMRLECASCIQKMGTVSEFSMQVYWQI